LKNMVTRRFFGLTILIKQKIPKLFKRLFANKYDIFIVVKMGQ
jgi:hypothetical protein